MSIKLTLWSGIFCTLLQGHAACTSSCDRHIQRGQSDTFAIMSNFYSTVPWLEQELSLFLPLEFDYWMQFTANPQSTNFEISFVLKVRTMWMICLCRSLLPEKLKNCCAVMMNRICVHVHASHNANGLKLVKNRLLSCQLKLAQQALHSPSPALAIASQQSANLLKRGTSKLRLACILLSCLPAVRGHADDAINM